MRKTNFLAAMKSRYFLRRMRWRRGVGGVGGGGGSVRRRGEESGDVGLGWRVGVDVF